MMSPRGGEKNFDDIYTTVSTQNQSLTDKKPTQV